MNGLILNFLTSGHHFGPLEYKERSEFILFNAIMTVLLLQLFILAPYRFMSQDDFQGYVDIVFILFAFAMIFLLRYHRDYHRTIIMFSWLGGFALMMSTYIHIEHYMIGGSWFAVSLLPAFFLMGRRMGFIATALVLSGLLIATLLYFPGDYNFFELLFGLMPIIMAALFISFYEMRIHTVESLLRQHNRNLQSEVKKQIALHTKELNSSLQALQKSETLLERSQEIGHVGSWEIDLQSGMLSFSPQMCRFFEQDPETFTPRLKNTLLMQDDKTRKRAFIAAQRAIKHDTVQTLEHKLYRQDGTFLYVKTHFVAIYDADDSPIKISGSTIDLSEQIETQRTLTFHKQILMQYNNDLFESQQLVDAYVPIVTIDLTGTIVNFNRAFSMLTFYELTEIRGKSFELFDTEEKCSKEQLEALQALEHKDVHESIAERRRKDGSSIWVECKTQLQYNAEKKRIGYRMIWKDITSEKILEHLATYDPLTKIYNRTKFNELIAAEFNRFVRYGERVSLIVCDLDHFKNINDTYGHLIGDKVLQKVAHIIKEHIRNTDYFARWGGEEFAILLPSTHRNDALTVAQKVHNAVREAHIKEIGTLTISCGISELQKGDTIDSWFKRVDDLLYEAKDKGRDQVILG